MLACLIGGFRQFLEHLARLLLRLRHLLKGFLLGFIELIRLLDGLLHGLGIIREIRIETGLLEDILHGLRIRGHVVELFSQLPEIVRHLLTFLVGHLPRLDLLLNRRERLGRLFEF